MKILVAILALAAVANTWAADAVSVKTTPIKNGLYLLQGRGGNVVASVGDDGVLLVDDDYAAYAQAYGKALVAIGAYGVDYLVNTHWHGDHTGSNAFWGTRGATIVAHSNVRTRLSARQENKASGRVSEASPEAAWPVLTFAEDMALHFNGETIDVQHYPAGHTDGDSVVTFMSADVVHFGDHFFKGRFPYIDTGSGGSVAGFVSNVTALLEKTGPETIIVPGHGELADRTDLETYLQMLVATRSEVRSMRESGMSAEQITARGLDARWASWGSGFINQERWIGILLSE